MLEKLMTIHFALEIAVVAIAAIVLIVRLIILAIDWWRNRRD